MISTSTMVPTEHLCGHDQKAGCRVNLNLMNRCVTSRGNTESQNNNHKRRERSRKHYYCQLRQITALCIDVWCVVHGILNTGSRQQQQLFAAERLRAVVSVSTHIPQHGHGHKLTNGTNQTMR